MEEANNKNPGTEPEANVEPTSQSESGEVGIQKEFETIQKELLYLRAEFDNSRKRMLKDQEQSIKFANEKLIRELLTIVDLFDRGLEHGRKLLTRSTLGTGPSGEDKELTNFVSGIDMTHRELTQVLGRFGVELIGTPGEKFDPNRHEAISQLDDPNYSDETVVQVFQKGCLLHGRLLVPARVAVGKPKA